MKLLLGLMFLLLGVSRFYAIPVKDNYISIDQDSAKTWLPEKVTLSSFDVLTVTDTAFKEEDINSSKYD